MLEFAASHALVDRRSARIRHVVASLSLFLAACGDRDGEPADARAWIADGTVVQRATCLAKPGPAATVAYGAPNNDSQCTLQFDCDWQVAPDPSIRDWVCSLDDLNAICSAANYQTVPKSLLVAGSCDQAKTRWPTAASWCTWYADYLQTNPNIDPTFAKCTPVNSESPPSKLDCKWPKVVGKAAAAPLCKVKELPAKYKGAGKLERGATKFGPGGAPIRVEFFCTYLRPCSGDFTSEYMLETSWSESCAPYGGDVFDYCHLKQKAIEKDEPKAYLELDFQLWTPADPKSLADFEAAAKGKCDALLAAPAVETQARAQCLQIYTGLVPDMLAACCEDPPGQASSSTGGEAGGSPSTGLDGATSEGTGAVIDAEPIAL